MMLFVSKEKSINSFVETHVGQILPESNSEVLQKIINYNKNLRKENDLSYD